MKKNATICRTITRIPIAIKDQGATIARRTGRTNALNNATRITASTAAPNDAISIPGMSQAVNANENVATMRVRRPRFTSDYGPPRHSQSSRAWVA